jgi:hypothetical protein
MYTKTGMDMVRKRKPGGGRKPDVADQTKTAVVSVRMSSALRTSLKTGTKRTLSAEIVHRLEKSFERRHGFGDDQTRHLGNIVALLAVGINGRTWASWRESRYAFDALAAGLQVLLSSLAPEGPATPPEHLSTHKAFIEGQGWVDVPSSNPPEQIGAEVAQEILRAMENRPVRLHAGGKPLVVDWDAYSETGLEEIDLDWNAAVAWRNVLAIAGRALGIAKNGDDK